MPHTTLVSVDQLAASLGRNDWRVIDCRFDLADTTRGETAYAQARIPGATYAHLDRDLSGPITPHSGRHPLPDVTRLKDWLGTQGITRKVQVIAYDDSGGNMAVRLWWLLRWLGHDAVALLDGGWQHWLLAGQATEHGEPGSPEAVDFAGEVDDRLVVSSAQLQSQLQSGASDWLVMDARTKERFRGDAEPIDPVAGRIPGAVNLPLQMNLGADGRFRPADELRRLYADHIGSHDPACVVAMCGSGVTACHNLLAMEIAGLHDGRLYAGSWSEWIRDPARPVASSD